MMKRLTANFALVASVLVMPVRAGKRRNDSQRPGALKAALNGNFFIAFRN